MAKSKKNKRAGSSRTAAKQHPIDKDETNNGRNTKPGELENIETAI
jgi:hypothetical protein